MGITTKQLTVFETSDGKMFEDYDEAFVHEIVLDMNACPVLNNDLLLSSNEDETRAAYVSYFVRNFALTYRAAQAPYKEPQS